MEISLMGRLTIFAARRPLPANIPPTTAKQDAICLPRKESMIDLRP
jgi:hypothetical protein